MTTGTVIIQRALQQIGKFSSVEPTNGEDIVDGKDALNSMLEGWLTDGIKIGFTPLDVPADNLNEPIDATNAIITELALELAASYDNAADIVSPNLLRVARRNFNRIKNLYQSVTIPDKVASSTLPKGAGNRNFFQGQTFFEKGETLGGDC